MKQYSLLFLCFFVLIHFVFAQESRNPGDVPLLEIEQTLKYGIDQAVIESIKTLAELGINTYAEEVFQRMSETANDDLLIAGFQYFDEIKYKNSDTIIPFAVEIMKNYQRANRRIVQHSMYYIKDTINVLGDSISKKELLDLIIDIVDTDTPSIVLPALEMVPVIYSEADITSQNSENENNNELQKTGTVAESTTTNDVPVRYSDTLRRRYDTTNVGVIRTAILMTLAQIQAYSQVDFMLSIITDESISKNIRSVAIKSLSFFENPDDAMKKSIVDVYETLRSDTQPSIRSAVLTSIGILPNTFFGDNNIHHTWLRNGLRDSDSDVRIAALESLLSRMKKDDPAIDELEAIEFIIENDPEVSVKTKAIEVLSSYSFNTAGREYIFDKVQAIGYPNALEKKFIDVVLDDFIDDGGVDILSKLIVSIPDPESSVVEYIAEAAKRHESEALLPLAKLLISIPNSSVQLNALSLIGRNRFTQYEKNVENLSRNRTVSNRIRTYAKKILTLLSGANSEEKSEEVDATDTNTDDITTQSFSKGFSIEQEGQ